jgi:hypothetical protein
VIALVLIFLIALGNFALGFCLASNLGHGPSWAVLPLLSNPFAFSAPALNGLSISDQPITREQLSQLENRLDLNSGVPR